MCHQWHINEVSVKATRVAHEVQIMRPHTLNDGKTIRLPLTATPTGEQKSSGGKRRYYASRAESMSHIMHPQLPNFLYFCFPF